MVVDIYGEEFLGRIMKVTSSTNSNLSGVEGVVVKETKNTFSLLDRYQVKVIPKNICQFSLEVDNKIYQLDGKVMCYRPENRLKELRRINKNLRRMN
ncbi:MAG: ribonuclease P component 1 family protein [Cuniculiplasma sp.]